MPASFSAFDQPGAGEHLLEVPLREALALGDHAETMGSRGLRRARVLEDLLRVHHRVHRRLRLRVLRLGAEPTVLGAPTRFRIHQRAHIRRVAEALDPSAPGALDQGLDLDRVLDLSEPERFLARDQRRHDPGR
jgi:hypothetical protein